MHKRRVIAARSKPITNAEAGRFLEKAALAPSDALIAEVKAIGYSKWLDDQLSEPIRDTHWAYTQRRGPLGAAITDTPLSTAGALEAVWTLAHQYPDKLRRKVLIALSEIFQLTATDRLAISGWADVLANNAFSTFRQLLEAIVRSPAMAQHHSYLSMPKEVGVNQPDSSFARTLLEDFTVGAYKLNLNGTFFSGAPVPAFTNAHVAALAKVFTGLSWGGTNSWNTGARYDLPLVMFGSQHSVSAKTIIDDVVLPAISGGNSTRYADADLKLALDTIANHSNVGPFFSKRLIQSLVAHNPTPDYVARVAAVFNDNGSGIRGDLKAVIKAVLLDQEVLTVSTGRFRSLTTRWFQLVGAFGGTSTRGVIAPPSWLPQQPFQGRLHDATEQTVIEAANRAWLYTSSNSYKAEISSTDVRAVWFSFAAELAIITNTAALIDRIVTLLGVSMTFQNRALIHNAIGTMPITTEKQKVEKACAAIRLVLISLEYNITL